LTARRPGRNPAAARQADFRWSKLLAVQTWLVAVVGGAVGSVVTAAIAWGAQFLHARGEVDSHDRFVADRDEDLSSWVSDRSLALRRELAGKTEELNKQNLFYSGTHGVALALLKERALHEYRDQERQARRDVAVVEQTETWAHRWWRRRGGRHFPLLTAPRRAERILDVWRSSVRSHGTPPIDVVDPTRRTLDDTQRELEASGGKEFV
jgi:hypothetical protein